MKNFVFYHGPSMLDGSDIIAIATESRNKKTGSMIQTWIMRADVDPVDASRDGSDASICGSCVHMGKHDATGARIEGTRSCYVQLYVPKGIWSTWQRDRYDDLSRDLDGAAGRVAGEMVRLGAYGDPAAVPFWVWSRLLARVSGHTGYTHQWNRFPEFAQYVMASCDSSADRTLARVLGYRTFRVAPSVGWQREAGEVLCAASAEAGRKTTCSACKACGGHTAKARADIVIPAHGAGLRIVGGK